MKVVVFILCANHFREVLIQYNNFEIYIVYAECSGSERKEKSKNEDDLGEMERCVTISYVLLC